ncbi:MAG: aminotransferase class V-fold PLP-dependent enzyme [Candidatus Omnitrophica bacterium]|nr:aminotransferase class V-fold PLP-dependent enzyme [Candidatus Omnitrophota bacterium]
MIYLDHNATTPVLPEVLQAMEPFWAGLYANPSSIHQAGVQVARKIKEARREVRDLLGAQDETEIIFTSGGTESNHTAIRSALATSGGKQRLVTTVVEHSSILRFAKTLEKEGIEVDYARVDSKGNLDGDHFDSLVEQDAALVSVMMANNETGVLFPMEKIAERVHSKGTLFHVDGVQAVGKVPICLKSSGIDFFSLSAHKFGGPKGVGVLYVRKGTPFHPLFPAGFQERGRRAGTENVPGIIGLGAACRQIKSCLKKENEDVRTLRDSFESKVLKGISGVQINGDPLNRLPNTSNLAFEGVDAEALLILLDEQGVYASSGSACLSGAPEPSRVLKAMGFSNERAKSSVRFSFGLRNTSEEADKVIGILEKLVNHLREIELEKQHPHPVVE